METRGIHIGSPPSDAPMRVVFVEDSEDDALLLQAELERAGYNVEARVLTEEHEFVRTLDWNPDLILSDHSMPRFDALRALDIVNQKGLRIPFLIVSGTIREDVAVQAMRRGASDYLRKDRLARLVPAIEHALGRKRLEDQQSRMLRELQDFRDRFLDVKAPSGVRTS